LLISLRSNSIAKKSLKISESQEKRQQPLFTTDLSNSFSLSVIDKKITIYAFLLTINNPTDINNSIKRIEFTINYNKNNQLLNYSTDHKQELVKFCNNVSAISLPFDISAHQAAIGWTLFGIENEIIEDSYIESYLITMTDTHGFQIFVKPIIVCEVMYHEKEMENETNNA
jgi:hypothetical protein